MSTFTGVRIEKFIDVILEYDSVEEILNLCQEYSEKGFVYERLWDIVIKFGYCDKFPNSQFVHIVGNVNTMKIEKLNLNKYLKGTVMSSNSSGVNARFTHSYKHV